MIDTQMTPKTLNHCVVHLDPAAGLRTDRGILIYFTIIGSIAERRFQYVPSSTNQLPRIELLPWSRNTLGRVVKNVHYVSLQACFIYREPL